MIRTSGRTVMDLIEPVPGLVPVGRLDADSRGLIVLTTDGDLAHAVSHPRHGVTKRYVATLDRAISAEQLEAITTGVELEDGPARALTARRSGSDSVVEVVMAEGRKREVRRLFAAVGLEVRDLVRVAVGPLELGRASRGRRAGAAPGGALVAPRSRGHAGSGSGDCPARAVSPPVITIDGPAGSGKTTLGRRLATTLGLPLVDTGLFYRGVMVAAARAGIAPDDRDALIDCARRTEVVIDTDPAHDDADSAATRRRRRRRSGAARSGQRAVACVDEQHPGSARRAARRAARAWRVNGAVAVGRDCGTVVFPDAQLKLYLDASEEVRAQRRATQLRATGADADSALMRGEVGARDRRDASRTAAPMRAADDAHHPRHRCARGRRGRRTPRSTSGRRWRQQA